MGLDSVESHDRRHAEGDAADPVFSMHHGGDRENGAFVSDDAFADPFDAHGDPVVGGLFFGDNVVGAVFYLFSDAVHGGIMVIVAAHLTEGV